MVDVFERCDEINDEYASCIEERSDLQSKLQQLKQEHQELAEDDDPSS